MHHTVIYDDEKKCKSNNKLNTIKNNTDIGVNNHPYLCQQWDEYWYFAVFTGKRL